MHPLLPQIRLKSVAFLVGADMASLSESGLLRSPGWERPKRHGYKPEKLADVLPDLIERLLYLRPGLEDDEAAEMMDEVIVEAKRTLRHRLAMRAGHRHRKHSVAVSSGRRS